MQARHELRGGRNIRIGNRIAGIWPDNIDPTKAEFKDIFELIDLEWVTSAPNILGDLSEKVSAIRADANLSEIGKREAIEQAGRSALNRIKSKTAKVDRLQQELVDGMESAIKTPTASLNDTMIDLALAAYLRDQVKAWQDGEHAGPERIASRLQGLSERARLAVIRVPPELSGIDTHTQTAVRTTFVDPAVAKHLEDTSYAVDVARQVVQVTLEETITLAQIPQAAVREAVGQGWDTAGVSPGRKSTDLNLMPSRKVDPISKAGQRADEDSAVWAEQERAAGRSVTDEQRQAKREQLAQQYVAEMTPDRTFTGREHMKEARTPQERQAIIAARLSAEEKTPA